MRTRKSILPLALCSILPAIVAAGCVTGGWKRGSLDSPLGATALIHHDSGRVRGELLMIRDDGVVISTVGRIVLSRWSDMTELSIESPTGVKHSGRRAPRPAQRDVIRKLCRYPYGLSDAQLTALLASVRQTGIEILE